MKKSLTIIGFILLTVILAVLSVMTAIRIRSLGTRPVAPSVPESKPKAVETLPDEPAPACKFSCSVAAIVSPSPTPTPPGPSNTPTPEPSSTPTPGPSSTPIPGESYCEFLHADETGGSAPLTVAFEGKGYDSARVKGYRFTFGDGEKKEVFGSYSSSHVERVSHTYDQAGIYKAVLEIMDDGDHWRTRAECEQVITTTTGEQLTATPGPTRTTAVGPTALPTEVELPVAGLKIPTLGGIIAGFLLISLGAALIF